MEQAVNSFNKGLNLDVNPMLLSNDSLSDCLNGTLITQNGNELILQNDMGNVKIDKACLPNGYEPVGIKEYGGIIYIASYNPITNKSLIGSFPSPERIIDKHDGLTPVTVSLDLLDNTYISESFLMLKSNSKLIPILKDDSLHIGDKFNLESDNLWNIDSELGQPIHYKFQDLLSNFNPATDPTATVDETNRQYTLLAGILNSQNEFVDITKDLIRWNSNNNIIDTSNMTDGLKYNVGYYISGENNEDNIVDFETYRKEAVNTYKYKLVGPLYFKLNLNRIIDFLYRVGVLKNGNNYNITFTGIITTNMPESLDDSTILENNKDFLGFTLAKLTPINNLTTSVKNFINDTASSRPVIDDENIITPIEPVTTSDIEVLLSEKLKLIDSTENNLVKFSENEENKPYVINPNDNYQLKFGENESAITVCGSDILAKILTLNYYEVQQVTNYEILSNEINNNILTVIIRKNYTISNIPDDKLFNYKLLVPVNILANNQIYQEDLCVNNTIDLSLAEENVIQITSWKWTGIDKYDQNDTKICDFEVTFDYNEFLSSDIQLKKIYAKLIGSDGSENLYEFTPPANNNTNKIFRFSGLEDLTVYKVKLSYDFKSNDQDITPPGTKEIEEEELIVYSECVENMIDSNGLETHNKVVEIEVPCSQTVTLGNANISEIPSSLNKVFYSLESDYSDLDQKTYKVNIMFNLDVNKTIDINNSGNYPRELDINNVKSNTTCWLENSIENAKIPEGNLIYANNKIKFNGFRTYKLGWKLVDESDEPDKSSSTNSHLMLSNDINDFIEYLKELNIIGKGGITLDSENRKFKYYNTNLNKYVIINNPSFDNDGALQLGTANSKNSIIETYIFPTNNTNVNYTYRWLTQGTQYDGRLTLRGSSHKNGTNEGENIIWIYNQYSQDDHEFFPYIGDINNLFKDIINKMSGGFTPAFAIPQNDSYTIRAVCYELNVEGDNDLILTVGENYGNLDLLVKFKSIINGEQSSSFANKKLKYVFKNNIQDLEWTKNVVIHPFEIDEPTEELFNRPVLFENNKKYMYISSNQVIALSSPIIFKTGDFYCNYKHYNNISVQTNNPWWFNVSDSSITCSIYGLFDYDNKRIRFILSVDYAKNGSPRSKLSNESEKTIGFDSRKLRLDRIEEVKYTDL